MALPPKSQRIGEESVDLQNNDNSKKSLNAENNILLNGYSIELIVISTDFHLILSSI